MVVGHPKNAKMSGWSPALQSLVFKYVCWCSRLQVCLRGVFFKVSKKIYSRNRFLASKRRIRRPHVIPRCTFIGLFVAWMIHVKKHSGYKIRQNQSSLSALGWVLTPSKLFNQKLPLSTRSSYDPMNVWSIQYEIRIFWDDYFEKLLERSNFKGEFGN